MYLNRLMSNYSLLHKSNNNILLKTLLSKNNFSNKNERDTYIKGENLSYLDNTYSVKKQSGKNISKDLFDSINNDINGLRRHGDIYDYKGILFTADQVPEIDGSLFGEIKAQNNIMDFGCRNYFKYISSDGKEHRLYANNKGVISALNTEVIREAEHDITLQKYAAFWNALMRDTTYLGLNYSQEEKKGYLKEAGIKPGFFTIKMGECEAAKFYSTAENGVVVYEKDRYDNLYKSLTEESNPPFLRNYEPGCIFKIGGKEYVLKDNHTLDIPYGEDVFDRKDPDNYSCGKKIMNINDYRI